MVFFFFLCVFGIFGGFGATVSLKEKQNETTDAKITFVSNEFFIVLGCCGLCHFPFLFVLSSHFVQTSDSMYLEFSELFRLPTHLSSFTNE